MTPEAEDLMHFFQEARVAAKISYRIWGLRLGVTRQRMHQIIEHGMAGEDLSRKILADLIYGPDNPFPEGIRTRARALIDFI
jgi:hypothetical protein